MPASSQVAHARFGLQDERNDAARDAIASSSAIRSEIAAVLGLAWAVIALGATFNGPVDRFWSRMTRTGAMLGGLAILGRSPEANKPRAPARIADADMAGAGAPPTAGAAAAGLASAAALYLTFRAGIAVAGRVVPGAAREIREIYAWRELRARPELALRLALVIGPAEELFWRGLVQDVLAARFGRWRGACFAVLAYSATHLVSGKLTLVGAAAAGGAHWSALRAAGAPLTTVVVSHVAWDLWIFLIQPIGAPESLAERQRGPR